MNTELLNELKIIYRDGFPEDSEADTDEFFSHIKRENAFYVRGESGQIVSAGYYTLKPARLFGKDTNVPFLSALSTHSKLRGQGRLRTLLSQMFSTLYASGESVCLLYPFSHTYYLRHGFCNVSFCSERTVEGVSLLEELPDAGLSPEILPELARMESEFARGFDNYLIYGQEQIASKIRAYSFGSAQLRRYRNAYCITEQNRIRHYAAADLAIFSAARQLDGYSFYDFLGAERPFAQGRIIHAKRALEQAVFMPEFNKSVVLQIIDPILCENNTIVEVSREGGQTTVRETTKKPQRILDIAELGLLVFCGDGELIVKQKNYFGDLW